MNDAIDFVQTEVSHMNKDEKIKRIQALIEAINTLKYEPFSSSSTQYYTESPILQQLRKKAKLYVEKIFGKSSDYLNELSIISFHANFPLNIDVDKHVWSSGKNKMLDLLNMMKEDIEMDNEQQESRIGEKTSYNSSNQVFIVHGHDEEMKQTVARFIEKILGPDKAIILHEQPDNGQTVIEKLENHSNICSFAIVLLSPDDVGYSKQSSEKNIKSRARQNVVFELGFFMGRFGRKRVIALYKKIDDFELLSDLGGVLYAEYEKDWQIKLAKELRACGFSADMNKL